MLPVRIILFTLALQWAKADMYQAMVEVKSLLLTHRSVIRSLKSYLDEENKRLEGLKRYLIHYKNENKKMEEVSNYIYNPVNSFTLIKRLTADLDFIERFAVVSNEFNKQPEALFPTSEDLEQAVLALSRLQNTYDLNAKQLADGELYGTFNHGKIPFKKQTSPVLATDCFEIGRMMYDNKDYVHAVQWLLLALHRFNESQEFVNFSEAILLDCIRYAYHGLNDVENAEIWTKKLLALMPDEAEAARLVDLESQITEQEYEEDAEVTNVCQPPQPNETITTSYNKGEELSGIYKELCRDEGMIPHDITKSLHCYYKSGPDSFLFLARIKTELLYLDPVVLLFHDVISDAEINVIKTLSRRKLKSSMVVGEDGELIEAQYRISKIAWFADYDSPVVARVSQRVTDFTELSTHIADNLQVANYGIGGHYDLHYDFVKIPNDPDREKIATVLFYMSNVEQGGATVFSKLNLTVFPIKNSALFWFNLHASGDFDYRTLHGACPVLQGSKWVFNGTIFEICVQLARDERGLTNVTCEIDQLPKNNCLVLRLQRSDMMLTGVFCCWLPCKITHGIEFSKDTSRLMWCEVRHIKYGRVSSLIIAKRIDLDASSLDSITEKETKPTTEMTVSSNGLPVVLVGSAVTVAGIAFIFVGVLFCNLNKKYKNERTQRPDITPDEAFAEEHVYSYISVDVVPFYAAKALAAANKKLGDTSFKPSLPARNRPDAQAESEYTYAHS